MVAGQTLRLRIADRVFAAHTVPFHVIVNPTLTLGPESVDDYEGCLSVRGFQASVPRAKSVLVQPLDHRGEPIRIEATGWYARILQHEIDHLDGTLYIDRMDTRTFATVTDAKPHAISAGRSTSSP